MIILWAFSLFPLIKGFTDDEHTQSVTRLQKVIGWRIVRCSDGVEAILVGGIESALDGHPRGVKKADFARTGAESADSEGLIDHIRAIEPVIVACVFEQLEPELTRISLRSKSEHLNVSDICAQFGGGGHPVAAQLSHPREREG